MVDFLVSTKTDKMSTIKTTYIYRAPKNTQPTSNLLTNERLMEILQTVPKDAKICIFRSYDGDGGELYVKHIEYDSVKNRVTIYSDEEGDSNSANAVDKGAPWNGGDIQSDSEDE